MTSLTAQFSKYLNSSNVVTCVFDDMLWTIKRSANDDIFSVNGCFPKKYIRSAPYSIAIFIAILFVPTLLVVLQPVENKLKFVIINKDTYSVECIL